VPGHLPCGTANKHIELERSFKSVAHLNQLADAARSSVLAHQTRNDRGEIGLADNTARLGQNGRFRQVPLDPSASAKFLQFHATWLYVIVSLPARRPCVLCAIGFHCAISMISAVMWNRTLFSIDAVRP
jgi:hypothetical protein